MRWQLGVSQVWRKIQVGVDFCCREFSLLCVAMRMSCTKQGSSWMRVDKSFIMMENLQHQGVFYTPLLSIKDIRQWIWVDDVPFDFNLQLPCRFLLDTWLVDYESLLILPILCNTSSISGVAECAKMCEQSNIHLPSLCVSMVLFVDLSDGLIAMLLFSSCCPYVVLRHQSITQPPTPHQEVARQSKATNSKL